MANPNVERIVAFYSTLYEGWLDRWARIVTSANAGTYTADALAQDTAKLGAELASCWSFAAEFVDPKGLPTLVVHIQQGQAEVSDGIRIRDPGGALVATQLTANGHVVPAANVELFVTTSNRFLIVRFHDMDQHPVVDELVANRVFKGTVHRQGDEMAVRANVELHVD